MKEIIVETILESFKLIPFLYVSFLIIELIEHKFSKKQLKLVEKSGKFGPILGSVLGIFPQCGFSVLVTNLYVTRIISTGTLIAIYLSTSDEMLPILLSQNVEVSLIIKILLLKLTIGMFCGFIIDFIYRKKEVEKINYNICEEHHCHCKDNLIISTLKHTINIFIFVLIINVVLHVGIEYLGREYLEKIFLKDSLFGPFITSLIGLIPNCAASVIITELYLNSAISFGSMLSGLLTGSGVALVVLFKTNKNFKENLKILSLIYSFGVLSGIIIDLICKLF